jgi:spore germination cell wall hydrolase CwlJ-like protein
VIAASITDAGAHQKIPMPKMKPAIIGLTIPVPEMKPVLESQIPDGNTAPVIVAVEIEKLVPVVKVAKATNQEFCLAQNIYFEARNQTVEGMEAVALVTLNRVASKSYPNTICKVVWQKKQFSWTHDGKSDTPRERLAWKIAKDVAASVLVNYDTTGYDFTGGAMWYHAKYVTPSWGKSLNQTATIGDHIFYVKG